MTQIRLEPLQSSRPRNQHTRTPLPVGSPEEKRFTPTDVGRPGRHSRRHGLRDSRRRLGRRLPPALLRHRLALGFQFLCLASLSERLDLGLRGRSSERDLLPADIVGNQTSHVDFRGKNAGYTFDLRNRLSFHFAFRTFTLGEPTVTFTYNPTGTRATMVDASGTTTYGYDARDRLLTKATPAGTLTYTYDPAGNVATIQSSNANGTSVNYAWDAANQLVSVTDNRAGGVTTAAYTVNVDDRARQ